MTKDAWKKFSDRNIEFRIESETVGKDRDGNVVTLHMHVHRDGRAQVRGQCPHPNCVVKDVIDT